MSLQFNKDKFISQSIPALWAGFFAVLFYGLIYVGQNLK